MQNTVTLFRPSKCNECTKSSAIHFSYSHENFGKEVEHEPMAFGVKKILEYSLLLGLLKWKIRGLADFGTLEIVNSRRRVEKQAKRDIAIDAAGP